LVPATPRSMHSFTGGSLRKGPNCGDRVGPGRVRRREAQFDVGAVGPAADLGCLVRGEVIQDDEQPVAVRAGGADGLERAERVAGAFVFPGDAPELVGAQGIAAVEVADPLGRRQVARSRAGFLRGAQELPCAGRIDMRPNWSTAQHRSAMVVITCSMRSSLASRSGSADSFHVRVRWNEMPRACRIWRSRSPPRLDPPRRAAGQVAGALRRSPPRCAGSRLPAAAGPGRRPAHPGQDGRGTEPGVRWPQRRAEE